MADDPRSMDRNRPRERGKAAPDVVPCGSGADVAQLVEQSIHNGKFVPRNPPYSQRAKSTALPRGAATLLPAS